MKKYQAVFENFQNQYLPRSLEKKDFKKIPHELGILKIFLCFSVEGYAQDFIDWAYRLKWQAQKDTEEYSSTGTNTTHLERRGDIITLTDEWENCETAEVKFVISRTEFVNLLKQWGDLYKQQPKEIVLTVENGKYTLEGHN